MAEPIEALYQDLLKLQSDSRHKLPPVKLWNPPLSGDMDLVIDRDGTWTHEGTPIRRQALVNLFASILKREGDNYFLVTPVEKWRIRVKDAPFVATAVEKLGSPGKQALRFTTNTGDTVIAGSEAPIRVEVNPASGEPSPYVLVRDNLEALISRPVFYQLAEWAVADNAIGNRPMGVESLGAFFPLE